MFTAQTFERLTGSPGPFEPASDATSECDCRFCDSSLEVVRASGLEVERCPDCGMVFVLHGQLRQLLGDGVPLPEPAPPEPSASELGAVDAARDDELDLDDEPSDSDEGFGTLAWSGPLALLKVLSFGLLTLRDFQRRH